MESRTSWLPALLALLAGVVMVATPALAGPTGMSVPHLVTPTTHGAVRNAGVPVSSPPSWLMLPPMAVPRSSLAVADGGMGPGGRIYALGGDYYDGSQTQYLSSVQAYLPSAGTWITTAPMPSARVNFAAAGTLDGHVYVFGGTADGSRVLSAVDVYYPGTNTWHKITTLPTPRTGLAATVGKDGSIYTIGGYTTGAGTVGTVEVYNPSKNSWKTLASLPTARMNLSAATDVNGLIYAMGGTDANGAITSTVNAYDPGKKVWSTLTNLPVSVTAPAAALGADGRIYMFGGQDCTYSGCHANSQVQAYNPAVPSQGWQAVASTNNIRTNFGAVRGPDGHIYAVGGSGDATAEAYGPVVTLATSQGPAGMSDTINGHNFAAAAKVTVYWKNNSTLKVIGKGSTDGAGTLTAPITVVIPGAAMVGVHQIQVVDNASRYPVFTWFTVTK